MIVDSSALLAIILDEPDAQRYKVALVEADARHIPSPNWVEVALVVESRADDTLRERFGRGRRPAKLNYGDCMAYGFAKIEGKPLLFKGDDFALTDIEPALKD